MNVRFGLVFGISLAVVAGACASGGGGGDGGISPRDDEHTNAAQLFLTQAQATEDSAQRIQRFEQALEAAMEGIQADSMNPQAYWQAGFAAVNAGQYQRGDTLLEKAVELYPDYQEQVSQLREQGWVDAYNSAIGPMNQGNLEAAARLFRRANAIYRGRPEAFLNLGAVEARLGNAEAAADAYEQALEIIRSDAIENVDSATAASWRENEEVAVFNLGQALAQAGEFDRAVNAYQDYIETHPDNVSALSNLAVVLVNAEMPDSAMAIYRNLMDRPDMGSRDYFSAGVGLYQIERYQMAAEAFRSALERNPLSRDALFNLAQTLFTAEEWQELVDVTGRLLERDAYNSNVYKMRAKALVEAGDQQAAGRVIEDLQALPFEIQGLQLQPNASGGALLTGVLTNRSVSQGAGIRVTAHFAGPAGQEVGTQSSTVRAPEQDGTAQFRIELSTDQAVDGYWYEAEVP